MGVGASRHFVVTATASTNADLWRRPLDRLARVALSHLPVPRLVVLNGNDSTLLVKGVANLCGEALPVDEDTPKVISVASGLLNHVYALNLANVERAENTANTALADVEKHTSDAGRVSHRKSVVVKSVERRVKREF